MSTSQDRPAAEGRPAGTSAGTQTEYGARHASSVPTAYEAERPSAAAFGFTWLAATLMILSGLWSFFVGLTAILQKHFYVVAPDYTFKISASAWGWTHLILGCVVFAAGMCLFLDMLWARIVGVTLAAISAIANFMFIPIYPVWSIVVIGIDLFVLWALLTPRGRIANY